ncbi:MAG: phosphoribosylformylglycinamidine synthase, partial [Gammaproteobacteria bacterium]|nr:phosphoribosylformylglycinamidine synthase [Gammaproteobacteria bacterium]
MTRSARDMLQLTGPAALSQFRLAKLLNRLRALDPQVLALEARFLHFADLVRPLSAEELRVLGQLLDYGPRPAPQPPTPDAGCVLVVPRPGTISPWSSKATDIVQVCGLTAVRRIERGVEYRLRAARPMDRGRLMCLAPVLHDRMTETALTELAQAARLFRQSPPRPLTHI